MTAMTTTTDPNMPTTAPAAAPCVSNPAVSGAVRQAAASRPPTTGRNPNPPAPTTTTDRRHRTATLPLPAPAPAPASAMHLRPALRHTVAARWNADRKPA